MSWDERQRAMLAEMGLRLPPLRSAPGSGAASPAAADAVGTDASDDVEQALAEVLPPSPPVAVAGPSSRPTNPDDRLAVPSQAPRAQTPRPQAAATVLAEAVPGLRSSLPGLESMGLEQMREAVPSCQACGLCGQRRLPVFGAGGLQPRWLVVTDPPDEADDAAGEPLTGDAGRLLDRMLAAVGERRGGDAPGVFVTPLVKCRPSRGRAPSLAELQACEAILARQLELLGPRVVLAMGLQAARRLTGSTEPLGRLRGRVHEWRGAPLVVTYHPAYLLRSAADKAGAWEDLCLARSILNP